jgi:hypothetical protein
VNADHVLDQLARLDPAVLASRLDRAALAQLAQALQVARTGPKADVAARITARAQLAERTARLGADPHHLAADLEEPARPGYTRQPRLFPTGASPCS